MVYGGVVIFMVFFSVFGFRNNEPEAVPAEENMPIRASFSSEVGDKGSFKRELTVEIIMMMMVALPSFCAGVQVPGVTLYWEDTYWAELGPQLEPAAVHTYHGHQWHLKEGEKIVATYVVVEPEAGDPKNIDYIYRG